MTANQSDHQKSQPTTTPIYIDRRTKNAIAREYLTWSLSLDHMLGREVTADDEPYCFYGREAVEKLFREVDPASPAPPRLPQARTRRQRAASPAVPAAPIQFVPDATLDDLWRPTPGPRWWR
jgi:hypothetical protein